MASQGSENPEIKKKIDSAMVYDQGIHEPVYSKTVVNNVKEVARRLVKSNRVLENAVNLSTLEVKPIFFNEELRKLVFAEEM